MPSEDRVTPISAALTGAREGFHSAVVAAAGEVEAWLGTRPGAKDGRARVVAAELGAFGADRIDADRFAALLTDEGPLDERTAALFDRALAVLGEIACAGDDLFRVEVRPGRDLAGAVDAALGGVGRAFGAARAARLAHNGRSAAAVKEDPAAAWPFARWNKAEREIAPPLVVEVEGGDLVAGGLSAFLDGRQKLALVVIGAAPPAALVRLITPGVFVMQTDDPREFARLAAFEGPGVAALVPEGCALFTHDPAAAASPAGRLTVKWRPAEAPRKPVGRSSAFMQAEELEQLAVMGGRQGEGGGGGGPAVAAPPPAADVLAAWLLRQADLKDLGA